MNIRERDAYRERLLKAFVRESTAESYATAERERRNALMVQKSAKPTDVVLVKQYLPDGRKRVHGGLHDKGWNGVPHGMPDPRTKRSVYRDPSYKPEPERMRESAPKETPVPIHLERIPSDIRGWSKSVDRTERVQREALEDCTTLHDHTRELPNRTWQERAKDREAIFVGERERES